MVLKVYLKILLIVLFYAIEFLIFYISWELFAKALRSFETCVRINENLCRKLSSPLKSTTSNESFKVTSVPCFFPDFDLLSRKLDNSTFKVL